jgi:phosphoglycolate phosphatase
LGDLAETIGIPLFDIDRTLLEEDDTVYAAAYAYAMGIIYQQWSARKSDVLTDGKIDTQILAEILKLHGVADKEIEARLSEALAAMVAYFESHVHETTPLVLPGAVELLAELVKRGIPLGILSGNTEAIGWRRLALAGIKQYFSFGAFGNLAFNRVDLIAVAQDRANAMGIPVHRTNFVIIGDSLRDVACAKAGGIRVIAVATGRYSVDELARAGADCVVKTLLEKERIVGFLSAQPGDSPLDQGSQAG